jgi:hypothetical protein
MKKKNLLLTAIAIFGLATITFGQTVPSYVPTSGLVGWWPFNGNANDESGNGNNGTVNGALLTSDRNSNLNSAYIFDGNGDFINCGNSPTVNITGSISVSSWIYANNLNGEHGIISKMNTGIATYELITADNFLRWMDVGGFLFSNSINTNQWLHVVSVFDNSLLLKSIYINGILSATSSSSVSTIPTNSDNLYIGAHQPSIVPGWSWDGKLDDIGVWNRALTQEEITDLYNGCQISVITQPTNQTININNNAQFVVSSSDPSATYQWQTDLGVGYQNLNSVGQYSGTTNDTLIVSNVTMSNNNQPFRCIITSGSCSDTSNVSVLSVNNNVGINEFTQDNLFSVYPNPAQNIINIRSDAKLIGEIYSIYDNTGKVVLSSILKSENTTIELGNLSGGIYLFSVGENMKQTFKLIKE